MGRQLTYSREVFDVADEAAARRIILTPEWGLDTDARWATETPYMADLLGEELKPASGSLLIDYGCGIGRLSKVLIERFDCRVLGVDISERMRALAPDYVGSQNFSAISPHMLHALVAGGLRADGALCVWVLQHCVSPLLDIELLKSAIRPQGKFTVVNLKGRAVPTAEGKWANDGIDVRQLLRERFDEVSERTLAADVVARETSSISFCATYVR